MTARNLTIGSHIPPVLSGAYPNRPGNLVRPLVGEVTIVRRLFQVIAEAQHSIWLTVAFLSPEFEFLDNNGLLFDALDRAVGRGVDVRLLVWRSNSETLRSINIFDGTPGQQQLLTEQCRRFRIRWDRAASVYCQHQKSWMVDAGCPSETAFVGGFNLSNAGLERHDVFVEIAGPSASDVHRNFVQRWNAASERYRSDGNWACDSTDEMRLPRSVLGPVGNSAVQIQRMMDSRRYCEDQAESTILRQYQQAIDAARRTIYIENQAIPDPVVGKHLLRALARGVSVILLIPAVPEPYVYAARSDPQQSARFECLKALADYDSFLISGLAKREIAGRRAGYVHAKIMIVDDAWATIGSCNLHAFSLAGHTELNASIWDSMVARELRCTLYDLHLGISTSKLEDNAALALFQGVAQDNRAKLERRADNWQGYAFALSAETYATEWGAKPDLS